MGRWNRCAVVVVALTTIVACTSSPQPAKDGPIASTKQAYETACEGSCTLASSCSEPCLAGEDHWEDCGWWGVCNNGLQYCSDVCDPSVPCSTECVFIASFNGAEYTTSCGSHGGNCNWDEGGGGENPGGSCKRNGTDCGHDSQCCSGDCDLNRGTCCARPCVGENQSGCWWTSDCCQPPWEAWDPLVCSWDGICRRKGLDQ